MTNVLLKKTPTIELDGEQYELPRLSTNLAFKVIKSINDIGLDKVLKLAAAYQGQIDDGKNEQEAIVLVGGAFLSEFATMQPTIQGLLATFLGVEYEEAGELPITVYPLLLKEIKNHPDLEVFLKLVKAMAKNKTAPTEAVPKQ